ncbi:MAG TPA: hypothetical protein VGR19_02735 [Allosphingosinicella sp.]|nr:hypothetical protein [Allosphingosinicella sp.]
MSRATRIGSAAAAAALALQGCSSMPREFSAVLAAAPADGELTYWMKWWSLAGSNR